MDIWAAAAATAIKGISVDIVTTVHENEYWPRNGIICKDVAAAEKNGRICELNGSALLAVVSFGH